MDELVTLGRADTPRGEVVLRRRRAGDDTVEELIVNGTFAMDSRETSSERQLAQLAYHHGRVDGRMLVGGLGLGYTAHEALHLPLDRIDVVEREPALVQWARAGLTSVLAGLAAEPRVHLWVGDVGEVLRAPSPNLGPTWDSIVLDVDNGPDFLIHADNASLYTAELLAQAFRRLTPGGRLAVWCQGPSPLLLDTMRGVHPSAEQHLFAVARGERRFSYAVCTLDRPGG